MIMTRRVRIRGPVLHPRLCAVVVAASSGVHVWFAIQNQHGPWLGALMLALAAVCLPCALHIWRHSKISALRRVMACAVAMVVFHGVLLLGGGAGGHAHGGVPASNAAGDAAAVEILLVLALEIATALLAGTLVARLRAVPAGETALLLGRSSGGLDRACSRGVRPGVRSVPDAVRHQHAAAVDGT